MSQATIQELTSRLIDVSRNWNAHDLVPDEQKTRCRKIGEEINAAGGMAAMQTAYYEAKARNRCASVIQAYWDGIGDWRW